MARTAEEYFLAIQTDLPTGEAWPKERDGIAEALWHVVAEQLAQVEQRADQLQNEADPRTTVEMLEDWERILGLPDPCLGPEPETIRRRESVVIKETAQGTLNLNAYQDIAVAMGYDVTFREYRPFRCGKSQCSANDGLADAQVIHKLRVLVKGPRKIRFRCGVGQCGKDPLTKTIGGEDLVCVLRRELPADLQKIFEVDEE